MELKFRLIKFVICIFVLLKSYLKLNYFIKRVFVYFNSGSFILGLGKGIFVLFYGIRFASEFICLILYELLKKKFIFFLYLFLFSLQNDRLYYPCIHYPSNLVGVLKLSRIYYVKRSNIFRPYKIFKKCINFSRTKLIKIL